MWSACLALLHDTISVLSDVGVVTLGDVLDKTLLQLVLFRFINILLSLDTHRVVRTWLRSTAQETDEIK